MRINSTFLTTIAALMASTPVVNRNKPSPELSGLYGPGKKSKRGPDGRRLKKGTPLGRHFRHQARSRGR